MKKILSFALSVLLFVTCLAGCGGSDDGNISTGGDGNHVHSFGAWSETISATCTTAGEKVKSCPCGEEETAPIPALGHTSTTGVCTRCKTDFSDPFTKLKNYAMAYGEYDSERNDYEVEIHESYDSEDSITHLYTVTYNVEDNEIEFCYYTLGEYNTLLTIHYPGNSTSYEYTYTFLFSSGDYASMLGYIYPGTFSADTEKLGYYSSTFKSNLTSDVQELVAISARMLLRALNQYVTEIEFDCIDIGFVNISDTHTHSFGAWSETVKPTCTQNGTKKRTCSCGYSQTETVYATHSWVDATCTTPKKCSVCYTTSGSALGHTTTNGVCTRCNQEIADTFAKLKNYIKTYGEYDSEDNEYEVELFVDVSDDEETVYMCLLFYDVTDDKIKLSFFTYDTVDEFSTLMTIYYTGNSSSYEYIYTFLFSSGNSSSMLGYIYPGTFSSDTEKLGYYSSSFDSSVNSDVQEWAAIDATLLLLVMDSYITEIEFDCTELGFVNF